MQELTEYVEILEGQDKAETTLQDYKSCLNRFKEWMSEQDLNDPSEVSTRDMQRFMSWLKNDREYAPMTIRSHYTPVSGFFSNLKSSGRIDEDPTEDIKLSNYASHETKKSIETKERRSYFTQEQLEQVVEEVPPPTVRNRLMILFCYYTGIRRQELVTVKMSDLDRDDRAVRIRGKGDKNNIAYYQPKLDGLLSTWIDSGYRSASPYAAESPYLFVSAHSEHVSADRFNSIVVEAAENAGIQETIYEDRQGRSRNKFTSHALRHSFAMHFLQNGGSLEALSKLMAHSEINTTQIYGEILEERARGEYDEYGPDLDW